jgi:hypothetical protein
MVDFIAYMRVSTDKQGITGLGMDAQREAVSRYVQNRGQIIAEFIEVESGKKHTNRPQLLAALAECRKRRAVLVIARLDRLARNVAFIANLMNSDVEFVAVDMPHANRLTIHILAGRVMTTERLLQIGLLAEPEPVKSFSHRVSNSPAPGSWPEYARCVQGAPMNHDGTAVDISRADYFWCLMAAQRGHGIDEIAAKLMDLSSNASENGEQYARITAENATAAAERGRQRSRA